MYYEPYIVYYHGKTRSVKIAECNSLDSARKLIKKKSGGQEVTFPWDGHTEAYDRYVIDKGNII